MENIKMQRLPETLRVDLDQAGAPGFYVLIVPGTVSMGEQFRDFFLVDDTTGEAMHMFGCDVNSDMDAAELALCNGPEYINLLG